MADKPTITPELKARFVEYHRKNPAWGSLHIVLDDNNVADSHIEFCIRYACENLDTEGEALGAILLTLSKTQRMKIGKLC